jgi:glutathione reductase (NADPH)
MTAFDYDLLVIGAGSGGVRASRMAAQSGARVAVVEAGPLGGTCVNVGCVPKKLFVYGSHFPEAFEDAQGYGFTVSPPSFSWATLRDNKTREIERLNGVYGNLLSGAGVTILRGQARITGAQEVTVGGTVYRAERILIATGSTPSLPTIPGIEHAVTSFEMFYLDALPKRAVVVGGGYIAVEFASILHGLGVDTTLVYRGPLILRGFDADVRGFVMEELRKLGITLRLETDVQALSRDAQGALTLTLHERSSEGEDEQGRSGASTLTTDLVMYATGRHPLTAGLGLEAVGVALGEDGRVLVNEQFQTSVPSIYALGDVINRAQLTPVAIREAMAFTEQAFGTVAVPPVDYDLIPTAVFCQPNIGTVGPTEEVARQKHGPLAIYEATFRPMKHTLTGREERTFMKLIVRRSDDRVVAAHMVGPDAGELIQGLAVAIVAGATKAQFDATVGIHPTAAEEFVTMRTPTRLDPL